MTVWDIFCGCCYLLSALSAVISVIFAVITCVKFRELKRYVRKRGEEHHGTE